MKIKCACGSRNFIILFKYKKCSICGRVAKLKSDLGGKL